MDEELVAQPTGAAPEGLAAELSQFVKDTGAVPPQPQPAPVEVQTPAPLPAPEPAPQAVEPRPEVPAKFQTPDGALDVPKVEKSLLNAEAMLEKLKAKEKELGRAFNKVHEMEREVAPQIQHQPAPTQAPAPMGFEDVTPQAIMQDLINNGATVDSAKAQANTLYILACKARQSAYQEAVRDLRQEVAAVSERTRAKETAEAFSEIAKNDPWMLSPDALETLSSIRQQYPHINNAEHPWLEAYDKHLAIQAKAHRAGGPVSTPTPKAPTASPVTPVGAAPRPEAAPSIDFSDPYRYEARLAHLPLDKQLDILEKELNRRGLPVKK